jgi:hypothetical protein
MAQALAAGGAAANVQNLEFNQAQLDSLNNQYDKQLKILETQRAATTDKAKQAEIDGKILKLEKDRLSGTKALRTNGKDILKDQMNLFKQTGTGKINNVRDKFFDSLKGQVREKYKGTGQEPFLDKFLNQSADLKSTALEVKIDTIVASGQMPPATAVNLMTMFAGKE